MSNNQIVISNLSKVYENGFNALKKINLDNITPRQAMDFLYDLKKISD